MMRNDHDVGAVGGEPLRDVAMAYLAIHSRYRVVHQLAELRMIEPVPLVVGEQNEIVGRLVDETIDLLIAETGGGGERGEPITITEHRGVYEHGSAFVADGVKSLPQLIVEIGRSDQR